MDGDDDLDRRLRGVLRDGVLRDGRLGVEPNAELLQRVHAGALRRQRRRIAASGAAALAVTGVVALTAGVVASRPHGDHSIARPAVGPATTLASRPASITTVSPSRPASAIAPSDSANGAGVFHPVSISAIGVDDYWVLGYTPITSADGGSVSTTVMHTTDGGAHFVRLRNPDLTVAQAPMSRPAGTPLVTDIRFGDANDGWAYGDALYQSTDAGKSWTQVKEINGGVVDLVAANGFAWAVVNLSATPGAAAGSNTNPRYAIYSTTYGKSPQRWSRVALPLDLGSAQPSIVDQDGTVTVLVSGPPRAGDLDHVLVAPPGGTFTDHDGPCFQEQGGYLSNSKKGVWAVCPTGTAAGVFVSTDRGVTWTGVKGPLSFPNPDRGLGGIDDLHAIVMNYATGQLLPIGASGSGQPVDAPTDNAAFASFIGFTNADTGYAIVVKHDSTSDLLRTTDGGAHWSAIKFGDS